MRVIYLAGPYRSATEYGVHQNIQAAEKLSLEVWRLGAVCICPVKNTAYFGGALPDSVWLDGALELVKRSDALLLTPEWKESEGACCEKALAESKGIPVFESIQELATWLESQG